MVSKSVKNQVKISIEIWNGSGRQFEPKNGVEVPQATYRAGVGEPMEGGRGAVPSLLLEVWKILEVRSKESEL